jgi:aquaporin Z
VRKYLAEFLGTAILVAFGCGSAITHGFGMGYLGIAFAFGLVIVALAYSIGNISGCHVNPAVSLAMWLRGRLATGDFLSYVAAQTLGATLGALILALVFGTEGGFGTNSFGPATATNAGLSAGQAFLVEVMLTFGFVLAIVGVTSKPEYAPVAGLVIGLSLTLVHIMGVPLTGTSVNPARSLGPALVKGGAALSQLWVFLLAPMVGGALAALTYKGLEPKHE